MSNAVSPPILKFVPDADTPQLGTFAGLPAVRVHDLQGASAVVLLHGAHVVSWVDATGSERLYLSPWSKFQAGTAVRGGIPVIFPQFSTQGPLPRHGLARTREWVLTQCEGESARFTFTSDASTLGVWPFEFACELHVALVSDGLDVQLTVHNHSAQAFSFAAALHTYLAIPAFEGASLEGLQGCAFTDAHSTQAQRELAPLLRFSEPLDRVYYDLEHPLTLRSQSTALDVSQQGFVDAVVWNPGPEGAAQTPDFAPDAHTHFVCVEAAAIGHPPALKPGGQWQGSQRLRRI
ncbi:D-hexose-6-phosphate mutarotase [Rhodoferax aquaticus]|nr:D-hexose-6-phosphate mutarotase [Rhodoferax aquaticus]